MTSVFDPSSTARFSPSALGTPSNHQDEQWLFTRDALDQACDLIYQSMPPTPQWPWPLLRAKLGAEVWVKHENMTPIGSFKIRGGLVYFDQLARNSAPNSSKNVVTATRGNHGQSVAFCAAKYGFVSTIVVPYGNSADKNNSMQALGAEIIRYGHTFDEALDYAKRHAEDCHFHFVPSFDPLLVLGVSTYAYEFFKAAPDLDAIYVPVGIGSGICGVIQARDILNLRTSIIGVVAENAPAYALSFQQQRVVNTQNGNSIADGVSVNHPNPMALDWMMRRVDRIVTISEEEILQAMGTYFTTTHQVAEGAGALGLAGLIKERDYMRHKKVGIVLCGSNVDRNIFQHALNYSL